MPYSPNRFHGAKWKGNGKGKKSKKMQYKKELGMGGEKEMPLYLIDASHKTF